MSFFAFINRFHAIYRNCCFYSWLYIWKCSFPEPLSSEEEYKYLQKFKNGDEGARNILIEKNLRLVAHVCKKYSNSNVDQDDLISIGTIGLIKGINSFNVEKGARTIHICISLYR